MPLFGGDVATDVNAFGVVELYEEIVSNTPSVSRPFFAPFPPGVIAVPANFVAKIGAFPMCTLPSVGTGWMFFLTKLDGTSVGKQLVNGLNVTRLSEKDQGRSVGPVV